jgi:diguanylate cyclase
LIERKKVDRSLASTLPRHEAGEFFRLMAEGVHGCAVFLMNADGVITVWNKAAEEMKGYKPEEAIGQHLSLLYTEEDRARSWPQHNLNTAAECGTYSEEAWRRRKDGSRFWAHIVLTALRGEAGELLGFSKITLDLTTHKELEERQKEKDEIELVLGAAEAGTWSWHVALDRVHVSRHFLDLLGYNDSEVALPFERWLDFVHPDERAALRAQLHEVRVGRPDSTLESQLRLLCRDGSAHWVFMRATWHAAPDQQVLGGVCVGINSLKLAEQETGRLLDQLREERARFANILDQMPSGVMLAEAPSGKLGYQNRAADLLLGRGSGGIDSYRDYAGYQFSDLDGRTIAPEELPLARALLRRQAVGTEELVYTRRDGSRAHYAVTTAPIVDADGVARMAVAVLHDVTGLKTAQLQAAAEKERVQVTLAAITDGVVTTDRFGVVTSLNPTAERLLGTGAAQALGRPFGDVLQLADGSAKPALAALERCLTALRAEAGLPPVALRGRDGQRYLVETAVAPVLLANGTLIGAVLVLHDVTESKQLLHRLGFEASHDALTGLMNRREFEQRLARTLRRAGRPEHSAALLYMDLDQFKVVNDTCGHSAGDDLLKQLARLYAQHVRERDTLARLGGDEFALIVEHCSVADALGVADKILDTTRAFRYACGQRLFQLGVSIGLTPIDGGTASVEEALRRADHACYMAKERGRNRVAVHSGDADFALRRSDMDWVTRLSEAFDNDELQLYCQPIVALADGDAEGHYEILLRLKDGDGKPILPGTFLPAAERYDVILKIDRWVLNKTLDWLKGDPARSAALKMCSINLSRRSLADVSFHQYAARLIDESGLPANKLCFEITENGAIADMQKTIAFIDALAERGCRFSLDDFGMGVTSFSYLKQLPVDFIKIDGSFIQMMSSSQVDFEMVRFANDISHMMGRQTIAEYVTDSAIMENLKQIGVDFAQGFWLGKPRPLEVRVG